MQETQKITVYAADGRGNAANCLYPHRIEITDETSAVEAFSRDIVCAEYRNNYRSVENFLVSNALPMDCDNDHTEDPNMWITPEDIHEIFRSVPHIIHYSRHHMKPKGEFSSRPRFHVVFLIDPETDPAAYAKLKQRLRALSPFFDPQALDAARFLFGTEDPQVEFHPGTGTLNTFLEEYESEMAFSEMESTIREGSRNNAMCRIGARIIKRYGDTADAMELFFREAERCDPPLEDAELKSVWTSCQKFHKKLCSTPGYIPPEVYNGTGPIQWDTPIPFDDFDLPAFPVDALPPVIRDYVSAVAETTQTAVDMAAVASLAIISICVQGKFRIWGKPDWWEPLNTFCVTVMAPGERKSAVISLMTAPIEAYEKEVNAALDVEILESQMKKSVLEKERRILEDKISKGKAKADELAKKAKEIAAFREVRPLKLFVDDVTTEKLTSILAENNGRAAIASAEGGIFDILSGIYTKNVNIDVFLKGHSGDSIRVDRLGRASECIDHPALTVLLSVQPEVLNGLMSNSIYHGRGLTARFLYSFPKSIRGDREFYTNPITDAVKSSYNSLIRKLLALTENQEDLVLAPEATLVLLQLYQKTEARFHTDLAEIESWASKYVGAVLRIAGLLHVAENPGLPEFGDVSEQIMKNAVRIGEYFLEHAKAAFSLMGSDPVNKQSERLLAAIQKNHVPEFSRRDAMRMCRNIKTAEAIQPVLNRLCEYGYIAPKPVEPALGVGRRPSEVYLTNPCLLAS